MPLDAPTPSPEARPLFEVCQPGLVLRALLAVQGLMLLAVSLRAEDLAHAGRLALESFQVSVPALLGWLFIVCALRLRLAAWPPLRIRLALPLLGAFCAWAPWQLLQQLLQGDAPALRGLAVAACGATVAAALLGWLLLRARAQAPTGLQARLVELQSRIRPHFLFNTLNTAIALVRVNPSQAERVLEDLAELFQAALAAPGLSSTLGEELRLARRYLEIEQLRFGERLRLRWELDPDCDAARLPPLLLQPLVENAVRYGVEPNEAGGSVMVRTRRTKSGGVELLVRNSLAAPAPGGHGLALANVRERLALLHDLEADLRVEPEPDTFSVRIRLP
jgi:two-component system sensor histidine kinase AlgZ